MSKDISQERFCFEGIDAEHDAKEADHENRKAALKKAMKSIGWDQTLTVWRVVYLIHHIAGRSDRILRKTAPEIAADKMVKRSARSVRDAIIEAEGLGIVESHEFRKRRNGRPSKALEIVWPVVFKIAETRAIQTGKRTGNQTGKRTGNQTGKRTGNQTGKRTGNQTGKPAITPIPNQEPNTTHQSTGGGGIRKDSNFESKQSQILSILNSITLANGETIQAAKPWSVEFAELYDVETVREVCETFEANKTLFEKPGAIRYRLKNETWPVAGVRSLEEIRAEKSAQAQRQREQAAREQAQADQAAAESKRMRQLDSTYGPILDAMSLAEKRELAIAADLYQIYLDRWRTYHDSPVVRIHLLEFLESKNESFQRV